jgi:hypothetical protein
MPKSFKRTPGLAQAERLTLSPVPALPSSLVCRPISRLKVVGRAGLCSLATVMLLAGVSGAQAQSANSNSVVVAADRIGDFVAEASRRFSIPPFWIRAVMRGGKCW